MRVKIKLLHPGAKLPKKAHELDAGFDLFATDSATFSYLGQINVFDCGFAIEIPQGYEAQIRPRSGLAINSGVTVVNAPATIDSGYRGSVKVGLVMVGQTGLEQYIQSGDRIAQMVIQKLPDIELECVDSLNNNTERGTGSFGSSGS